MPQLIRSVATGADDGHIDGTTFYSTSGSVYAGKAGSASQNPWFRFTNITVPKNAVITSAYLRLYFESHPSDDPPDDNASGDIYAEDADDPSAFDSYSGGSVPWTGRTPTTASVSWPMSSVWSDGTSQDSPDIKSVIQEIVNRAGWASGQAMVLWWEDDSTTGASDEWQFASYESASTEPKLEINYTTDVELEADIQASGSVSPPLFVDPKLLQATIAATGAVSADMDIPRQFFIFPGTSGNYVSCDDVNQLTADTAHLHQSVGNWLSNYGFEDGITTSTDLTPTFGDSHGVYQVDGTGRSFSGLYHNPRIPVTAGNVYSACMDQAAENANDGRLDIVWYDGVGAYLSQTSSAWTALSTTTLTQMTITGTAPAGAAEARVLQYHRPTGGSGLLTDNEKFYWDRVCFREGSDARFIPSVRIEEDLDIRASASAQDWDPAGELVIIGRDDGSTERAYKFTHIDGGSSNALPRLVYWDGGVARVANATAGMATADYGWANLRVTADVSAGNVDFYEDGAALGATVSVTAGDIDTEDCPVYVGARGGTAELFVGRIESAEIRDGIDGPVVAIFSAAQSGASYGLLVDGYTWTDYTGHTWTVHGSALSYTQDRNTMEVDIAAEGRVGGQRDSFGAWRSRGPALAGPQQDTKLVKLFDDVQLRVDFAPDTINPLQHPAWASMSTDLISARWSHGRSASRDQGSPGQLEIVLNNNEGRWDQLSSWNGWVGDRRGAYEYDEDAGYYSHTYKGAAGAIDGNRFRVGKQIRVQAVYGGTTYDMWRGVIDSISMRFPTGPGVQQVETVVTAQDHLQFLALAETNSTFAQHNPQERIKALLDEAGWPDDSIWRHASTSDRDRGLTETTDATRVIAPVEADKNSVLDMIQQAAVSDGGVFLINTAGQATFHSEQYSTAVVDAEVGYRLAQLYAGFQTDDYPLFEVSPSSTQTGYTEAEWSRDDKSIWTAGSIAPYSTRSSTGQALSDATISASTVYQDLYGTRSLSINDSVSDGQTAITGLASRIAAAFVTPTLNSVFRANIGRDKTHWLPNYLRLQQDDYVQTEQMYAYKPNPTDTRWLASPRQGFINQFSHQVDIRSQSWQISVNVGDRFWP